MTTSPAPLDPGTISQAADALAEIATIATIELAWSDHTCDQAMHQIAEHAHQALSRLGYRVSVPGGPALPL